MTNKAVRANSEEQSGNIKTALLQIQVLLTELVEQQLYCRQPDAKAIGHIENTLLKINKLLKQLENDRLRP